MTVLLAHVDGTPEHQGREWDSRDPCPEAKGQEEAKHEENDTRAPIVSVQIEDGRPDSPADVQDPSYPYELLGESTCEPDVAITEDHSDDEDEYEKDHCACVECKGIRAIIDASSLNFSSRCISMKRYSRDRNITGTEKKKLPGQVVSDPKSLTVSQKLEESDDLPESQPIDRSIWVFQF